MENKIWVIKAIREIKGWGLKEALDLADAYEEGRATPEETKIVEDAQIRDNKIEGDNQKNHVRIIVNHIDNLQESLKNFKQYDFNDVDDEIKEDIYRDLEEMLNNLDQIKRSVALLKIEV